MTDLVADLTMLVQEWRESAEWEMTDGSPEFGKGRDQCANELAALLTRAATPAKEPEDHEANRQDAQHQETLSDTATATTSATSSVAQGHPTPSRQSGRVAGDEAASLPVLSEGLREK